MCNGQVPCHPSQRATVEEDSQTHIIGQQTGWGQVTGQDRAPPAVYPVAAAPFMVGGSMLSAVYPVAAAYRGGAIVN